jgi:Domain of unknown function DUF29
MSRSNTIETIEQDTIQQQVSLYNLDYHLWILNTAEALKAQNFSALDLEHLLDEILALSRREKKRLKSLLRRLIEHLLKLQYWDAERDRNQQHWKAEITNFRKQIKDELEDSPSLKSYLREIFSEAYEDGRELASMRSGLSLDLFPPQPLVSLDQILDQRWYP